MEDALNDYKRLDYIQRHIATLKESIEYESTLELISSIYFASVFYCSLFWCNHLYVAHAWFNQDNA
jgi:hypothetical protein